MTSKRLTFKKIIRVFLYFFYLIAVVFSLLEIAYRFQVIDFYKTELEVLNHPNDLSDHTSKKTIVIGGDSFSVQARSYAKLLQDSLPEYRVINSAITGTSIIEASYILPRRAASFDPDIFIYQVYVGNDLLGIRHQLNWQDVSVVRNCYWWLSERFRVLGYINYKLGQWNWHVHNADRVPHPVENNFTKDVYSWREKMYAVEDPYLISSSVLLQHGREEDMEKWLRLMDTMRSELKPDCKIYLLVIPHKAQINSTYLQNMKDIGFQFDTSFESAGLQYPFLDQVEKYAQDHPAVRVLNPLAALQHDDTAQVPAYYPNDEHLTEQGQAVVAQMVLSALR